MSVWTVATLPTSRTKDGRSKLTVLDTLGKLEQSPPGVPDGPRHQSQLRQKQAERLGFSAESAAQPRAMRMSTI